MCATALSLIRQHDAMLRWCSSCENVDTSSRIPSSVMHRDPLTFNQRNRWRGRELAEAIADLTSR